MRLNELGAAGDGPSVDPGLLRRRFRRDGCLLVRRAIDPRALAAVTAQVAAALVACGVARSKGGSLQWTGLLAPHPDDTGIGDGTAVDDLVRAIDDRNDPLRPVAERLCGRPMRVWRGLHLFVTVPDDGAHATAPHQDDFAVGPDGDHRRMWFPLTEVAFGDGGLGVALGSHRRGRLPRRERQGFVDRARDTGPPRQGAGIAPSVVDDHWHTAAMSPGDVVMFHPDLVHRGLPVTGDRIRIALAVTVSRVSDPVPPVMRSAREHRAWFGRIRTLAAPLGLSDQQLYAVAADMARVGVPIDEATIRAAADGAYQRR